MRPTFGSRKQGLFVAPHSYEVNGAEVAAVFGGWNANAPEIRKLHFHKRAPAARSISCCPILIG